MKIPIARLLIAVLLSAWGARGAEPLYTYDARPLTKLDTRVPANAAERNLSRTSRATSGEPGTAFG